uniref:Uncharacterized protein n=1 Tax=Arundo donax TaxID=35708 RepID=A0A0A9G2K1_ARUDO
MSIYLYAMIILLHLKCEFQCSSILYGNLTIV